MNRILIEIDPPPVSDSKRWPPVLTPVRYGPAETDDLGGTSVVAYDDSRSAFPFP